MAAAIVRARSVLLRTTSFPPVGYRCASTKFGKAPARLEEVQRLLYQAEERYKPSGAMDPIRKISLDHVKISYANTGGSGGQGFNKSINTKVDMRFNVKNALWLDEKVRERIMQMEKHRINKYGDIVVSSKKAKAQRNKAEDAIAKLQVFAYQKKKLQAIIDAASYAPPPLSEETVKKIAELTKLAEQKQLEKKKLEKKEQKKLEKKNTPMSMTIITKSFA